MQSTPGPFRHPRNGSGYVDRRQQVLGLRCTDDVGEGAFLDGLVFGGEAFVVLALVFVPAGDLELFDVLVRDFPDAVEGPADGAGAEPGSAHTPQAAMTKPAIAGPAARDTLTETMSNRVAAAIWSRGTSSVINDCQVGEFIAIPAPAANTNASSKAGGIMSAAVRTASSTTTT